MFVRPNGLSLINASFQIIYIQPLKLICIYPGYILISFVTIYTAQKRILHAFFSLTLSIFNRASAVENPFICCWVLVQVIWWIQRVIFHFLTKQPDVYINFFFPCDVRLSQAGKLIVLVDFGLKRKKISLKASPLTSCPILLPKLNICSFSNPHLFTFL